MVGKPTLCPKGTITRSKVINYLSIRELKLIIPAKLFCISQIDNFDLEQLIKPSFDLAVCA